jgi:hypothetical protein
LQRRALSSLATASLPRPGGNLIGFITSEASFGGKWLELLTEIAPGIKRVGMMFNPDTAPFVASNYLPSFEGAARSLKVASNAAPVHNDAEIETVINSLGREPGSGLVVMTDAWPSHDKGAPAAPGRWAASRDKVERNKATILTFRLRPRDADHIRSARRSFSTRSPVAPTPKWS